MVKKYEDIKRVAKNNFFITCCSKIMYLVRHKFEQFYTDDMMFSSFSIDDVQIHLELVSKNNMQILVDVLKFGAKIIFDLFYLVLILVQSCNQRYKTIDQIH